MCKGAAMSCQAKSLFRKLGQVITPRRLALTSVIGGLAVGLSALVSMLPSVHPLDASIEIRRTELHNRVQRVRDALHTAEGAPMDRGISGRLAQWYNWGNTPRPGEPWRNYR